MENVSQGHWVFAGVFAVVFVIAMIFAYRKDLRNMRKYYKHVWRILVAAGLIYALIFLLNRIT